MSVESRYRLLLRAYPSAYRIERAEEMLGVLLATQPRRGARSTAAEAMSLVGHGLVQRLRLVRNAGGVSTSWCLAGLSLVMLLMVLGAQQLVASGLRALGLDGTPEAWGMQVLWVDPRWPVHAAWVLTGLALLVGCRAGLIVALAWGAAGLHLWEVASIASGGTVPWPGDAGPHWVALLGPTEVGWLLLSLAAAALLSGSARTARARARVSTCRWWGVATAGLVGIGLGQLLAVGTYAFVEEAAPAFTVLLLGLPMALAAGVLIHGLVQAPSDRLTLVVLVCLAAVPLAVRGTRPLSMLSVAATLVATGWVLASIRLVNKTPARTVSIGQGPEN